MNIYEQQPPTVATNKLLEGYVTYINLGARKLTKAERRENEIPDKMMDEEGNEVTKQAWTAHTIVYKHKDPLTEADYGHLVAAIVRSRYSADDVEAIMLNYSADQTEEHRLEFNQLQTWRQVAKEAAREAIG